MVIENTPLLFRVERGGRITKQSANRFNRDIYGSSPSLTISSTLDTLTPISAYLKLSKNEQKFSFLFERLERQRDRHEDRRERLIHIGTNLCWCALWDWSNVLCLGWFGTNVYTLCSLLSLVFWAAKRLVGTHLLACSLKRFWTTLEERIHW